MVMGEGGEAFGELDHWFVGEAGQHHVLELVELLLRAAPMRGWRGRRD